MAFLGVEVKWMVAGVLLAAAGWAFWRAVRTEEGD